MSGKSTAALRPRFVSSVRACSSDAPGARRPKIRMAIPSWPISPEPSILSGTHNSCVRGNAKPAGMTPTMVEGAPVNLIETVAARIAELCLEYPPVTSAEVTVHKPEAPVGVPFDDVSVTVVRARA